MRLRYKPWIAEAIVEYQDILVNNPKELKEKWQQYFGNNNPIHVELGTGKGDFISGMAKQNPDINFIGIELQLGVIYYACKKVKLAEVKNVALIKMDIKEIEEVFGPEEISRFYINFCDPWPKDRHAKRRLTHHGFLAKYKKLLKENGEVHFKTDNRGLFEFSLTEFELIQCPVNKVTFDLHKDNLPGNVMTEYEARFSSKGFPIYRCELLLTQAQNLDGLKK
jgi:tRNA (guanine-N7-)-methyltransferase